MRRTRRINNIHMMLCVCSFCLAADARAGRSCGPTWETTRRCHRTLRFFLPCPSPRQTGVSRAIGDLFRRFCATQRHVQGAPCPGSATSASRVVAASTAAAQCSLRHAGRIWRFSCGTAPDPIAEPPGKPHMGRFSTTFLPFELWKLSKGAHYRTRSAARRRRGLHHFRIPSETGRRLTVDVAQIPHRGRGSRRAGARFANARRTVCLPKEISRQ